MSEFNTYVCPNCGANTTNAQNCEYCGSLLVRFVEKGIDLTATTYTSNDAVFTGLIAELQKNLRLQEVTDESVVTDIWTAKYTDDNNGTYGSVLRSGKCAWLDGTDMNLNDEEKGFVISLNFSTFVDSGNETYNANILSQQKRFEQLKSASLFTKNICYYTDEWGDKRKGVEFAIDFGCDAEGAARLISEVLNKVYEIDLSESMEYYTKVGVDNVNKCRAEVNEARGFGTVDDQSQQSNTGNNGCAVTIIALIGSVASIIAGVTLF